MVTALHVVIGILLLQMYAHGNENATNKLLEPKVLHPTLTDLKDKETTKSINLNSTFIDLKDKETTKSKVLNPTFADLDNKNISKTEKDISKSNESISINNNKDDKEQRQKRGYNFDGFQPFLPIYPNFDFKNDLPVNGANGREDPLVQIHKKLSDIATTLRQTTMPPVPPATRYPIFLPFLYLPLTNSGCKPGNDKRPLQPKPTQSTSPFINVTSVPSRGPEASDSVNVNFTEEDEDFSRPISFDPIPPIAGTKRRPPPVEHGSVQDDITSLNSVRPTTTSQPLINSDAVRLSPGLPTPDLQTLCDIAIISCCHQVTTTNNCFATQGCPDLLLYGNPCNTAVIVKVIERLRKYYAQRTMPHK